MNCKRLISALVVAGAMFPISSAFAADTKAVKKAEGAMMGACNKEYAKEVKGKSFKEVADWVETEERGTNAETFKKSSCYTLHEKWEVVAGNSEASEVHETK